MKRKGVVERRLLKGKREHNKKAGGDEERGLAVGLSLSESKDDVNDGF